MDSLTLFSTQPNQNQNQNQALLINNDTKYNTNRSSMKRRMLRVGCGKTYHKFIHFVLNQTKLRTSHFIPSPLQEKYSSTIAMDGTTELKMLAFQAPKIRLLRSLSFENETMQVLDLAVLPKSEYDLPIFCANFFTTTSMSIVVLDLNPLYNVIERVDYKEKYYKRLMPLALKYTNFLPWGGKLTSESLRFFSPIVIWTKFCPSQTNYDVLYSAFMEYYEAWLDMMDQEAEETNISQILMNCEAQHKYLTWRTEKDPGHRLLTKLIGDAPANDLVRNFLFNGTDELGTKSFLDYFPEYECDDGTINGKRSVIGKSFEHRPWNSRGEFVANF